MLRIQRSFSGGAVFSLSGRIEIEDVAELQRLLSLEASGERVALDLRDITLVGRDALQFLALSEAKGIKLENCRAYIREWIDAEKPGSTRQKP